MKKHHHTAQTTETCELAITGMSCASCSARIEKSLKKAPGVKEASVSILTNKAKITYDTKRTDKEKLTKVVQETGYDVYEPPQKLSKGSAVAEFTVLGMGSTHCEGVVKKALQAVNGVTEVETSFANE